MSGLRSTLALCGILMVMLNGCIADRRFSNCGQIESCFRYFEGACTSDGERQVCLALDATSTTCPVEGSTTVDGNIDGSVANGFVRLCRQNEFFPTPVTAANQFDDGVFICQNNDLVKGGDFYTFGIGSEFGLENTDSRQVTITNYQNGKADCMGFTDACAASGNNDFTLRFRVTPCPNATTTTAATTTTEWPCNCTPWANFGPCSTSCDPGLQEQRRTCMGCNPIPLTTRFVPCNLGPCTTTPTTTTVTTPGPVDGMWGQWGPFGSCSATCGGGTKTRTRTCNNPPPSNGGMTCVPPMQGQMICNPQTCDETLRECRDRVRNNECAGLRGRALRKCLKRECGRKSG